MIRSDSTGQPKEAPVSPTWYATFFDHIFNEIWRRLVPPEATADEAAFIARWLAPDGRSARLLDLPCGSGRHALALAAMGHDVTGRDISDEALAHARGLADAAGLRLDLGRADMADGAFLPPGAQPFDGVCCFGNSFGYLTDADSRRFLSGVAAALRPGGRFALDTGAVAECLLPTLRETMEFPVGDLGLSIRNRYDPVQGRLMTDFTVTGDGLPGPVTKTMTQAVYRVADLLSMLMEAGLHPLVLASDPAGAPFTLGAHRLLLVAEKTG